MFFERKLILSGYQWYITSEPVVYLIVLVVGYLIKKPNDSFSFAANCR